MQKNLYKKLTLVTIMFAVIGLAAMPNITLAANYYWRATAVSGVYTNVNNWELGSPGSGIFPAVAPGVADDVFFPVASSFSTIALNGGNCRDFNVTAASPATFTFSGTMTSFAGSLNCNGQATFSSAIINFTGAGSHTILIGTAAQKVLGGALNFTGPASGTYSLSGPLNIGTGNATINFNGQSFNTNGYDLTSNIFNIAGSGTKTINFSNSLVTILSDNANSFSSFSAPSATTTYAFTNTRLQIVDNNTAATERLVIGGGVSVSFDSLIFNSLATGLNFGKIQNAGTVTVNVMKVNSENIQFGLAPYYLPYAEFGTYNIGKIFFAKPAVLDIAGGYTFNVGSIVEAPVCGGQSSILANNTVTFNTTAPITTSNIAYYGLTFGGSGLTTSSSNNLGINSGAVTWTATSSGISYWWVGGDGNWNDPTQWSITGSGGAAQTATGCLPTLNDNVFFDAGSFTGTQTVTIPVGATAYCKNLDWSAGTNQGLLTTTGVAPGGSATNFLMINGSANFSKARGIASPIKFVGSGTHTITSGSFFSYTSPYIYIQGTGTYTLADNFTTSPTTTMFGHRAGSFNTAGYTMDVSSFCSRSFPPVTANMRNLNISNSNIIERQYFDGGGTQMTIDVSFLSSLNAGNSHFKNYMPTAPYFAITRGSAPALPYLATANLNNITFYSPLVAGFTAAGNTAMNFNEVSFLNNANINGGSGGTAHNVNNYNLTGGYTYAFTANGTFNVLTGINNALTPCQDLVVIKSQTPGTRTYINKASGTFNVNSAFVTDVNSSGVTMNVIDGVDGGNNFNVTVGAATGRTMYWVNNAGNWSDGIGHWSIGVSGGNPAITNPNGCLPRAIDSVVFDNNSFTASSQTVMVDVDASFKGMMWTSAAGADLPVFASSAATRIMNNYGCFELGAGMTFPYAGRLYMYGKGTGVNQNYIDMNSVVGTGAVAISLEGGGRYDLLDSIRNTNGNSGLTLNKGSFLSNGHNIYAGSLRLEVINGNSADISNSTITATWSGGYRGNHNAVSGSTWNASGSTIIVMANPAVIGNGIPVTYHNLVIMSAGNGINSNISNMLIANKVTLNGNNDYLDGLMTTDTLQLAPFNIYGLVPGSTRTYTVNDTIIAYGTPCTPTYIRSATVGTPAILKRTTCNTDLNFVNLRDINMSTCTGVQNKAIGTDEGGNTNWTITTIPSLTKLGADVTLMCNQFPFIQSAIGFGTIPGISYLWGGGQTTREITITTPGTYTVDVTYGPACTVSDSRTITISGIPPVVLASGYEQVSPTNCTANGYTYYEGATASLTDDLAILAINANGNSITPTTVKVNNQGNLTGSAPGIFSNSGTGYYQHIDGPNTVRVTKRLHTVIAPGSYTINGGVKVRVYYTAADTATLLTDTWPLGGSYLFKGWFKHMNHTAQEVVNDMMAGDVKNATGLVPIAYGTENGVKYAEFLLSSFSTIGYMASTTTKVLPVALTSFDAQVKNCKTELKWRSAIELQFKRYDVEYSINGRDYTVIGNVNPLGDNSNYNFIHTNPTAGKAFYRLRMIDIDGSSQNSKVLYVNINCGGGPAVITVYPNPVKDKVIVTGLGQQSTVRLFTVLGQELTKISTVNTTYEVDMTSYPAGTYLLQVIQNDGTVQTIKLIKE